MEELKTIVEEASHAGRKVAAHAHGAASIKEATLAGVASIEHGSLVDDEGIRLMREHGTFMVPTLYTLDFIVDEGPANGVPEYAITKARAMRQAQRANLKKAWEGGVKFAYGTDAAVFPHGRNARDFAIMVDQLGIPPLAAIRTATASAAELVGIADKVGTLKAGLWADIIAVEGNPARRHPAAGARAVRDEGRRDLQGAGRPVGPGPTPPAAAPPGPPPAP